jgi:hypothetical protein
MQIHKIIILAIGLLFTGQIKAQIGDRRAMDDHDMERDVRSFYAETKQVSQFIRRFNGEEDIRGKRLHYLDSAYRNVALRRKFITALFDSANVSIAPSLKRAFINDVTNAENPKFLDFHGEDWFGEAYVKFARGNSETFITLFMQLVKENLGSKWVIADIYYPPYEDLYERDEESSSRFLHPMSHELDFMNLDKVFKSGIHTGDYFYQGYDIDKLSIFLYELHQEKLKFKYVSGLKFHFFQIDGWYFEISEFNRPGMNRGWLISNLIKLEDGQKEQLENFILHRE